MGPSIVVIPEAWLRKEASPDATYFPEISDFAGKKGERQHKPPPAQTSATAIGGMLPLALSGSGLYGPMSVVIIGGLLSSTILSRLVTPALYLLLAQKDAA